ncbi:MAG: hypothetical protein SFV54_03155 [Bryobacteraceae bacterium]|nr:hypothetical protein [Bryobacteraceae bacterium]
MSPERPYATSWKEIAAYLGVSVRTAQLWEKERGLPVRRLPGPRGPVSASLEELDAWRAGDRKSVPAEPVAAPPVRHFAPWPWAGAGFAAAVLVVAAVWAVVPRPGEPANWKVTGNTLVVTDTRGREVFSHPFEERLDDYYHRDRQNREHAWIGDLDGDGEKEVVFGLAQSLATIQKSDRVVCYSARGEEKWKFELGAAARRFEEKLRPPYRFRNLAVLPSGNRLVVAATHHTLYASQVALLSPGR